MKRLAAAIFGLLFILTLQPAYGIDAVKSRTQIGFGGGFMSPDSTGGPDEYGYTWIDSNEPGGPAFEWVDITGTGTLVTGLGDDNSVGPFPIGFDFPYYWYKANQFYVGSNGWISFSSGQNFAHPFAQLPLANLPNDLLACLSGDIDFTKGGECYYYTSPGLDSLVVSYIDVAEFYSATETHTFQLILTRADSTITYQYGEQVGDFSEGGSNAFSMGWENSTGTIGLSYYYNNAGSIPPIPPPFADSTVIKFIPPESTSFAVDDIGVVNALSEGGMAVFIDPDSALTLWSDLKNFGNQVANLYGASCVITDSDSTLYTDSIISTTPINPGDVVNFIFDDPFAPPEEGAYTATFGGHLPPGVDLVPENDFLPVEVIAFRYPGELSYDDGTNDGDLAWSGDYSGFGNEFIAPRYPVKVEYASIGITGTAGQLAVFVYDDDGPGGGPGTVLASDTVSVSPPGQAIVDFSAENIIIEEGSFFVGAMHMIFQTVRFAVDQNPPLSRRGWEYTGGWAPSRYMFESDIMIRAGIGDPAVGVEGDEPQSKLPAAYSLLQNYPNPFNPQTTIRYEIPGEAGVEDARVLLRVYSVRGRFVKTLVDETREPGRYSVTWDGKDGNNADVMSGVYLIHMEAGSRTSVKKMLLVR